MSPACPAAMQTCSFCRHLGHHSSCCWQQERSLKCPCMPKQGQKGGEQFHSIRHFSTASDTEGSDSQSPCRDMCPPLVSPVKPIVNTSTPAETGRRSANGHQQLLSKSGASMETSPSETKDGSSPASTGVQTVMQSLLMPPLQQDAVLPESPTSVPTSQTQTLSLQGLDSWIPFQAQMDGQSGTSIPMRFYR